MIEPGSHYKVGSFTLGGTISYYQDILVVTTTDCSSLYKCTGNLNISLYYPNISEVPWQPYWSSSTGNHSLVSRHPLYIGQSGYNCNNRGANFATDSIHIFYQRPAL